tara:strand:+ start:67098 stop:68666 length:1569 start_codon:yes stop_codon:yes gene_type:complete
MSTETKFIDPAHDQANAYDMGNMVRDERYDTDNSDLSPTNEDPHFRELPHNIEAEQGLLGALMADNRQLENVNDFLRSNQFFMPAHQRIYDAINILVERGQSATPVTLKGYFEQDEDLDKVGGTPYLAKLAGSVISVINTLDYARNIYELHLKRELISLGQDVVNESYGQSLENSVSDTIEQTEKRLFDLAEQGEAKGGFQTLRESVMTALQIAEVAYQSDGHISGVSVGLADLDKKLGGMHKSDLLILAGRPSMGKTALAVNMGFNAAKKYAESGGKEGAPVAFFSLEMSAEQLAARIMADQASVSGDTIRKGTFTEDDFRRFAQAANELAQVPFYIDDTPALSIGAVRTRSRRLKRQHGLGMVIVDYLQLLRGSGSAQSQQNRVLEVGEITRGLKAIAKELEIPVLALSQLSRGVEQREDKRPMLSDLRESGSIEQDADVVMFVYREEYYLAREEPAQRANESAEKFHERYEHWSQRLQQRANVAETVIAKQRHGPIGIVDLHFDPQYIRFSDLHKTHEE